MVAGELRHHLEIPVRRSAGDFTAGSDDVAGTRSPPALLEGPFDSLRGPVEQQLDGMKVPQQHLILAHGTSARLER